MDQQDITDVIKKADKYASDYLVRAKVIAKENKLWATPTLLLGIVDKLIYFENVLLLARQKQEELRLLQQEEVDDSGLNLHIKEEDDTGKV
jgi:hypothetical protein